MRAAIMYEAGDVRVEKVPDAGIVEPTDALLRVTRACICGSDLWPYASMEHSDTRQSMGHEAIGVVEDVGADVRPAREHLTRSARLPVRSSCDRQESPHRATPTIRRSGEPKGCYGPPRRNRLLCSVYPYGAAMESNHPSGGLLRPAGLKTGCVTDSQCLSQSHSP
jgi:Alcohol dehydrogenase GroES-like domain